MFSEIKLQTGLSVQIVMVDKGKREERLPYFPCNRLTDGGEASFTRRAPFTPRKISGTHLC
jgi:hypothetical protein